MTISNNKTKSLFIVAVIPLLFACGSSGGSSSASETIVDTPETEPTLPIDVPESEPTLPIDVPESEPTLPIDVPESEPTLPVDVPESEPTSPVDVPESEPTLPVDVPESEPNPDDNEINNDTSGVVLSCVEDEGSIDNNRLNTTAKKNILCLHNETRSQVALGLFEGLQENHPFAKDMQRLQWDNELEAVAQNWANKCNFEHNANRTTEYNALSPLDINGDVSSRQISVGENLAVRGSSADTSANITSSIFGYNLWVDEGNSWAFGTINGTERCTAGACGHFTQQIWASTYKVGCAVNFCEAGTTLSVPSTYLVCNYASAGNFIGREPYATGSESEVCSETSSDQDSCKNGLIENINYQEGL